MITKKQEKKISKHLSYLLRHSKNIVNMDEYGYVDIKDLIDYINNTNDLLFSIEELQNLVETNNKNRFKYNIDKTKLKACQGHSIDIKLELQSLKPKHKLYHGTSVKNLKNILEFGIQKMSRHHVHLSKDIETAKNVGSRHGKPIILELDTAKMHLDSINFYKSENDVWLVDYVNPKYIKIL